VIIHRLPKKHDECQHRYSASPRHIAGWYVPVYARVCLRCGHLMPISDDLAQQMLGRRFPSLEGSVRKRLTVAE
jgi:hypothetical protein